jgi:dihydrofolate reductase
MRKVVLAMAVSLDGYVATSGGALDWIFPNIDAELQAWIVASMRTTDTQILGRVNYQEQAQFWPTADDELAPLINDAEKVVFSSTLTSVEWKNSRLAKADVAHEVDALRQQAGGDILVPGGARFAQHVSRLQLVDEYRLVVHPAVLGEGMPLFTDPIDLKLLDCVTFATGAIALTYRRA